MTDTRLFREYVRQKGVKMGAVAESASLTYQGFLNKINNDSEFKASEIEAIRKFTNMPDDIRDAIFFGR